MHRIKSKYFCNFAQHGFESLRGSFRKLHPDDIEAANDKAGDEMPPQNCFESLLRRFHAWKSAKAAAAEEAEAEKQRTQDEKNQMNKYYKGRLDAVHRKGQVEKCSRCGLASPEPLQCKRCFKVYYCSRKCQLKVLVPHACGWASVRVDCPVCVILGVLCGVASRFTA